MVEQLAPSTIELRRRVVLTLAVMLAGAATAWDPGTLTRADCETYCKRRAFAGRRPSTLRVDVSTLRAWGKYLVGHGVLSSNPAAGVRPPKIYREEIRVLTVEEVKLLIGERSLPGTDRPVEARNRVQWGVAYAGALRVGELCRLEIERDLEWDQQALSYTLVIRHAKGASEDRRVPLPVTISRLVAAYLREIRPLLTDEPSPLLFPGAGKGGTQSRQGIRRQLQSRCRVAGIEAKGRRLTPHLFRHSRATHLLDAGNNVRYVQAFLGHASLESTQIYTHVSEAKLRRMVLGKDPLEERSSKRQAPQVAKAVRALLEDLGAMGRR